MLLPEAAARAACAQPDRLCAWRRRYRGQALATKRGIEKGNQEIQNKMFVLRQEEEALRKDQVHSRHPCATAASRSP